MALEVLRTRSGRHFGNQSKMVNQVTWVRSGSGLSEGLLTGKTWDKTRGRNDSKARKV